MITFLANLFYSIREMALKYLLSKLAIPFVLNEHITSGGGGLQGATIIFFTFKIFSYHEVFSKLINKKNWL